MGVWIKGFTGKLIQIVGARTKHEAPPLALASGESL
jgi:hypothetical protein